MLRTLDIRDMLIIDRLELAFRPGLNVLTGETGAGKSILIDCLGFVLGWRGRADLVRTGADLGEVVASFELAPEHPAQAVLEEAGLSAETELVLRRVNTADGRKTAWVNDRRVSGDLLRALSEHLVELHGQRDDGGLLNPRGHRRLLDAFAGLDGDAGLLAATRAAWRALSAAEDALHRAEAVLAADRGEEEFLRHAVTELDALAPRPGEEAELDARRRAMQAADRIREDVARAQAALSPDGAEGRLADAARWLEGAAARSDAAATEALEAALSALSRAMIELAEAQAGVEACVAALDFDPRALEQTEERLFALRALARKHGVAPDDLGAHADGLRRRLDALDGGTRNLDALRANLALARAAHARASAALGEARRTAAIRLDAAMAAELPPLRLDRAVFATRVTAAEAGPDGSDAVVFEVATNPGTPAGPLDRIASGGELSRFLLALKVCLMRDAGGRTLIFDEIDSGIGGATADAVGRRLATLADGGQLLVVTHAPQVAARGAHHWRVEKAVQGDRTLSRVIALDASARIEEIARMLAGEAITDAARDAAVALLSG